MSPMRIRQMCEDDLPLVLNWATAEQWRPADMDMRTYFAADHRGLFCGVKDGEIIGIIGAMRWGSEVWHSMQLGVGLRVIYTLG